jgi:Flp pilus assembly protein TadD
VGEGRRGHPPACHRSRARAARPIAHGADVALALDAHGRHDQALDVLARAMEHRPDDPRLLEVRGRLAADRDE